LILDLDRFKEVNDTHGHVVGDEVLTRIAQVLRASIRASDALCRWGGEEFLVMLRDCSLAEGVRVAEKIRKAVEEATVRHKSQEIRTTVSIGVTAIMAGEAVEVPLHRADRALYSAKENGRNRVEQG
jgi:diguanylate cyclase (GGDEF)-like protein